MNVPGFKVPPTENGLETRNHDAMVSGVVRDKMYLLVGVFPGDAGHITMCFVPKMECKESKHQWSVASG